MALKYVEIWKKHKQWALHSHLSLNHFKLYIWPKQHHGLLLCLEMYILLLKPVKLFYLFREPTFRNKDKYYYEIRYYVTWAAPLEINSLSLPKSRNENDDSLVDFGLLYYLWQLTALTFSDRQYRVEYESRSEYNSGNWCRVRSGETILLALQSAGP